MGVLYIVGTPIGNLADISRRALDTLRQVDLIAAEDTRTTRRLLSHFDIHTPLMAYTDAYERGKPERTRRLLEALEADRSVALVSEAGMPVLSDPGYELVRAALDAGHELTVIPGPSAITTALVASGLPADRFTFVGFLPRRPAARRALLARLADDPSTLVAFETPHRLQAALADLLAVLGDRPAAVARELTKRFEEVWRGGLADAASHFERHAARGEVTLVIGGAAPPERASGAWSTTAVRQAIELLQAEGLAPSAIARLASSLSSWRRSDVYDLLQTLKE